MNIMSLTDEEAAVLLEFFDTFLVELETDASRTDEREAKRDMWRRYETIRSIRDRLASGQSQPASW
jgi:hypothetical protein